MNQIDNIMALADEYAQSGGWLERDYLRAAIEQALTPGEPVAEYLSKAYQLANELRNHLSVSPAPQPQPKQEPVNIGAEWTPCMKLPVVVHVRQQRPGEAHVSTREGITPVNPDDLIMRGVSGEEYPIGRAIFEQTYTLHVDTAPQPQRDDTDLLREALTALEACLGWPETIKKLKARLNA